MQDFPKMLYSDLNNYIIVDSSEHEESARAKGYTDYNVVLNNPPVNTATKAQIIDQLTTLGIDHNPRDTKADLAALLPDSETSSPTEPAV